MSNEQTHLMVLQKTHTGGAEEWLCPECGRRVLIEWPPTFRKIVLDEGDMNVTHSGSKGGLWMNVQEIANLYEDQIEVPANTSENDVDVEIDENRLDPWKRWIDASGFDDL